MDISQAESNKTTVCVVPSIHLPLTREARALCEARVFCPFTMVVGMERFDATGGASKASDKCAFAKISENNKDRCNGRGKPTPLRKVSGIVRFRKGVVV